MVKEDKRMMTKYVCKETVSSAVQPSLNVGFCQNQQFSSSTIPLTTHFLHLGQRQPSYHQPHEQTDLFQKHTEKKKFVFCVVQFLCNWYCQHKICINIISQEAWGQDGFRLQCHLRLLIENLHPQLEWFIFKEDIVNFNKRQAEPNGGLGQHHGQLRVALLQEEFQ